jgi:coenzyme PQQ precursor peptide PqqA
MNGPRWDEHEGLMRAGEQLRKELTEFGKFQLLYISPVNAAAHDSNLQACGGCDVRFATNLFKLIASHRSQKRLTRKIGHSRARELPMILVFTIILKLALICITRTGRMIMAWTTPTLVEICIGLEINGYLPAEF